jgi:hypothetical protein
MAPYCGKTTDEDMASIDTRTNTWKQNQEQQQRRHDEAFASWQDAISSNRSSLTS